MELSSVVRPTLLIKTERAQDNIKGMIKKAENSQTRFRPHFKTHQSLQVGRLYRELGVNQITVSSVEMAEFFANDGWSDILIAFPVNIRELSNIQELSTKIHVELVVESVEVVEILKQSKVNCPLWIKVDVGYERTGLKDDAVIKHLANQILEANLPFKGLLTHAGHSYTSSREQKEQILKNAETKLLGLREKFAQMDIPIEVSYGDTPTCSIFDDFSFADELRPGNFVFYDLSQLTYGSCTEEQIAASVLAPVVAVHEDRIVLYGGGVHFSKDILQIDNEQVYGYVVGRNDDLWGPIDTSFKLSSISQEHGIVTGPPEKLSRINIGDLLQILPVHSCMT